MNLNEDKAELKINIIKVLNNKNKKFKRKYKKAKEKMKNKHLKNSFLNKKFLMIILISIILFLLITILFTPKILKGYKNNLLKINQNFKIGNNFNELTINNNINKTNYMKLNASNDFFNNISNNYNNQIKFKDIINTEKDFQNACINKRTDEIAGLYFRICSEGILLNKTKFHLSEIPKISIILPIYNKEKYILRVLRSIQNQSMKDLEIIFVDDFSIDLSKNIIKNYQKEDERIILIEHDKNEGTLISRNDGALKAKGEYIMFVDPDDLLLPNVLDISYKNAKKGNFDIIRFALYFRTLRGKYFIYNKFWGKKPIYQPNLYSFMYYGNGYLKQIDYHLFGKLIKKEVFIKTINSIGDYYLKNHMTVNEDCLMNFMLLKKADSMLFIHFFGYIYTVNPQSTIRNLYKHINKSIKDYVLYLRFMIEYTENNTHEKAIAEQQFKEVFNRFKKSLIHVNKNFEFLYDSLNLYLNCSYISEESKEKVIKMIDKIKIAEKNVKINKKYI